LLNEPTWQQEIVATTNAPAPLPYTGTRVFFRYDSRALYVGLKRPPMGKIVQIVRFGAFSREQRPWLTGRSQPDQVSRSDNWWRLIVSPAYAEASAGRDSRTIGLTSSSAGPNAPPALYFTVAADGTRAEGLGDPAMRGAGVTTNGLDFSWNAPWESAGVADTNGWTLEMAIPWATLEKAGLKKEQLAVNFLMNDPGLGTEALTYLGMGGYDNCSNFTPLGLGAPVPVAPRAFTVRLHFAEPDANAQPGERVFDVKLQGQTVLKSFDIVKASGAPRTALIKEFKGIKAAGELALEFVPLATRLTPANVPVINAMELWEEGQSVAGAADK
ncbi:MAG: hypothetical protein HYV36_04485, partial [Lentisphaerae bacterium]|nr:hypothetical protein [Lentisphaerota bacterium]